MNKKLQYGAFAIGAVAVLGVLGALDIVTIPAGAEVGKEKAAKAAAQAEPAGEPISKIVKEGTVYATVNGTKVTGKEVLEFSATLPPQLQQSGGERILPIIVNQLVNDKLVTDAGYAKKLEVSADVKEALAKAKDRLVHDAFLRDAVKESVNNEEALRKKYEEMLFNTPKVEQAHVYHILVADEAEAKDIIKQLNRGGDFSKIAKEKSLDTSNKEKGGDLGYIIEAQVVKEFAEAAFKLEKGQMTQEPVKTQFGYHVIKLEEKRPMPKPEFDQVKGQVQAQLADDLVRKAVADLREKAKIDLNLPEVKEEKK